MEMMEELQTTEAPYLYLKIIHFLEYALSSDSMRDFLLLLGAPSMLVPPKLWEWVSSEGHLYSRPYLGCSVSDKFIDVINNIEFPSKDKLQEYISVFKRRFCDLPEGIGMSPPLRVRLIF